MCNYKSNIGILTFYIRTPIVSLFSNYNHNYFFGSSATDKMTDIDSNTDYPDKNGDSIHNVLHNCVISGNENSLSVGGNLNMGSSNVGGYKANHGGLM